METFSQETKEGAKGLRQEWEKEIRETYEKKLKFALPQYRNESGIALNYVYDSQDIADISPELPGQYPYTRGIRALGYQYMPWMIQMLHGYGTSEETRRRTDFLLKEGVRGYKVVRNMKQRLAVRVFLVTH